MKRIVFIIALFLSASHAYPQTGYPAPLEDSLYALFEKFQLMETVEAKQELNARILNYMKEALAQPESFEYAFDSLRKRAGILKSEDNQFRIFTWNIPLSAFEHDYHGIIQVCDQRENSCTVHILRNRINDIGDLLNVQTDKEMWPGALYYDLRRNKNGREIFYTLIGFNFHDRWSDKKIIEILQFDRDMNPHFGKPVFKTPDGIQHRVMFEYSGNVAMNLRYNPDMKMIVYDHLSPIEPELKNHPRFYAPDFSYDGYKFRRGMWEHQEDLDVRNR